MANVRKIESSYVQGDDNTDGVYLDASNNLQIRHLTGGVLEPIGGSEQVFTAQAVGDVPLTVVGKASQTADLLQVKKSDGTVVLSVHADGTIHALTGGSVHFDL